MDGLTALGMPLLRRSVIDDVTGKPVITSPPTGEVVKRSALLPLGITDEGRMTVALPQAVLGAYDAARFPGQVLRGEKGVFDPATGHVSQEAMDAANGIAGIAMTGGLGGAAIKNGEVALGAGPIRAYHGSPHDFDKFSLSKIGTGEGAQAYGHGLYFAGNEGVAQHYRDVLSARPQFTLDKTPFAANTSQPRSAADLAAAVMDAAHGNPALASQHLDTMLQYMPQHAMQGPEAREILASGRLQYGAEKNPGRMYEVAIDADPAKMLDWHTPIAEQSKAVKDAFFYDKKPDWVGPMKGYEAYLRLGGKDGSRFNQPLASQRLLERDIPGIKYLDGNSRGAGAGSHNYVTFSDDIVNILRKYGLAGMIGGGAAAASMMQPGEAQAAPLSPLGQAR